VIVKDKTVDALSSGGHILMEKAGEYKEYGGAVL
jgi:hypothetical protein